MGELATMTGFGGVKVVTHRKFHTNCGGEFLSRGTGFSNGYERWWNNMCNKCGELFTDEHNWPWKEHVYEAHETSISEWPPAGNEVLPSLDRP